MDLMDLDNLDDVTSGLSDALNALGLILCWDDLPIDNKWETRIANILGEIMRWRDSLSPEAEQAVLDADTDRRLAELFNGD